MARGREGGKGRTPVPDYESAKVATLKCGGPPTMPEENRGPWSKKFENRWFMTHWLRCISGLTKWGQRVQLPRTQKVRGRRTTSPKIFRD